MAGRLRKRTTVLRIDAARPEASAIAAAGAALRARRLVAFPTETVYGLGANALDAAAVRGIFAAKGRPTQDPLIVHIAEPAQLAEVAREVPRVAEQLAAAFWPGPLSLVLPKAPAVPPVVTAGLDTVAVRMPDHPVALALIRAAGVPVAAPSANRFGHTSPTDAQHVLDDLDGRIDLVLDAGPTQVGLESTVVDVTGPRPIVLRPGGVTVEALKRVAGSVVVGGPRERAAALKSPGLLETHYAPRAELVVFFGPRHVALEHLQQALVQCTGEGKRVGLQLTDDDLAALGQATSHAAAAASLGPEAAPEQAARRLFAGLRRLDRAGVETILARAPEGGGLALTIRDRLTRAATTVVSCG